MMKKKKKKKKKKRGLSILATDIHYNFIKKFLMTVLNVAYVEHTAQIMPIVASNVPSFSIHHVSRESCHERSAIPFIQSTLSPCRIRLSQRNGGEIDMTFAMPVARIVFVTSFMLVTNAVFACT